MAKVLIFPMYWALCFFRLVFLSGKLGAKLHNLAYWLLFHCAGKTPMRQKLIRLLGQSLAGRNRLAEWQSRIYTSCPAAVRHALRNVFVLRMLFGARRRKRLQKQGHALPQIVMLSLNTPEAGCNLACTHCYAMGHDNAILPLETAIRLVAEQEALGIYNVRLLGGEPFLYQGLWTLLESFPQTTFYVATNGTRLDRETVRRLASLGNVMPQISLEGFREATDACRGQGVFDQVVSAMRLCAEFKLPYTVTATVTKENLEEVTGSQFLEFLDSLRCCGVTYSCYVPMGQDPRPELVISSEQSKQLDGVYSYILNRFAMLPTVGRNGTNRVSGCYAASEFLHVLPNGQVEACPFAQWADPNYNVNTHGLLEIMASPMFSGIRELNRYGVPGLTACRSALYPSLQTMLVQLGARPTSRPQPKESVYVINPATIPQSC